VIKKRKENRGEKENKKDYMVHDNPTRDEGIATFLRKVH